MTISQRQFTLLTEMGISLWQRRVLPIKVITATPNNILTTKNKNKTKTINLAKLHNQQIFSDIILSLNLLASDIKVSNEQLYLKQLTWQFTDTDNINLSKNILTTPSLHNIARSAKLKRQLWQVIQEHLIEKHSLQKQSIQEEN